MLAFENYLAKILPKNKGSKVISAANYSLLAGGKRVRPKLLFATLRAYDIEEQYGYAAAASIEIIHTYSLIHDDLPAMDNDTLRRGKPTCHVKFGEAFAILAGDALLTHAFSVIAKAGYSADNKVKLIELLSSKSGLNGMIYGQELDILNENNASLVQEDLMKIHEFKTGCLIQLPLLMAAILGNAEHHLDHYATIGRKLGLLFQIQDDVFDVSLTSEQLGKNAQSDLDNEKCTYVTILGIEWCEKLIETLYNEIIEELACIDKDTSALREIIDYVKTRSH